MGSQVIKVLRQGVWGSLTGGWYYDPRHSKFTNVFHLYTWLILMCLPFIFYMVPTFGEPWAVISTYVVTVATLFLGIKIANFRLHSMFDEGDVVERKVIQPDDQTGAIDQVVAEDSTNGGDSNQPTLTEVIPVPGSAEALGQREQEGNGAVSKILEDSACKGDSADRVTKRDLEADVHVEPIDVEIQTNNNDISKDVKKHPKKRRHGQQQMPGRKAVAFAEVSVPTKKRVNVGRCVSLSSASSDSDKSDTDEDDTDDDGYSSNTESFGASGGSDSNGVESSVANESDKEDFHHLRKLRPRARAIRRRPVRGITKNPWYNRPETRPKLSLDGATNERESSISSSCSDESSKATDNNNETKQSNAEGNQPGTSQAFSSRSRRKRISTGRSTISPQRKLPALEAGPPTQESQASSRRHFSTENNTSTQVAHDRENERELATSDQELLDRDPVWRARRSQRYSSDHRLFFRRRSYTVNSHRSRERDRRRLSTVPPYNGRRNSPPPRRPPSSLQKLLSLWSRDPIPSLTQRSGASSPGQVSPGQVPVVLTGHSVDNSEFHDQIPSAINVFFPPDDKPFPSPNKDVPNCSGDANKLLKPNDSTEKTRPKSESGSHNSNPHCNEISGSTPEAGVNRPSSPATKTLERGKRKKKNRPKKAKRKNVSSSRRSLGDPNTEENQLSGEDYEYMMPQRPPAPGPLSGANAQVTTLFESPRDDSEDDMNRFVNSILGATAAWQGGADSPISGATLADPETGASTVMHIRRKSSPDAMRSNRDELVMQKNSLPNMNIESGPTRRPRHSFPISSDFNALAHHPRPPTAARTRSSSGGRRVRHPAGDGGSHSRLTSNTSEEGGTAAATTTLQQISANSITSTTELLGNAMNDDVPAENIEKVEEVPEVHFATQHDDTSAGATHAFQDEHGNWFTYTFGESTGAAQMLTAAPSTSRQSSRTRSRLRTHSSLQSGDTSDDAKSPPTSRRERTRRVNFPSIARRFNQRQGIDLPTFLESDNSESFTQADSPEMSPIDLILASGIALQRRATTPRVKLYYRFNILPNKPIILQYDRLALLDLLDRNRLLIENILAIILALIVAILGLVLLQRDFFHDIWPLWFCAVIATAQYSLVRSVQPDSASPTHGHNRAIAYSRPLYFCIMALLILLFDFLASDSVYVPNSYIYANVYFTKESCVLARSVLIVLIMVLPFIFLLGLLPQINTFIMYLAEQIEIHMFGGSACTSLLSALYSLLRSVLFCMCLFGFCYGGMKNEENSQHILFSVFCGLLVSFSYHLSRQTNDPLHLWKIIRTKFLAKENTPNEEVNAENGLNEKNEENPDELSSIYVQSTLSERLQSDLILCPLIAVFMFAIHCSTAFTVLQPTLSLVLYIIAGVLGLVTHYVLPQLRKQLPWLLFSSPILKTKEYSLFEVQEEAKVMWFDTAYVWLCFVERNIIYPIVILNELTRDAPSVINLYGLVWGCIIVTFVGLKLLRSSYGVTLLQYIILIFSALFKHYDARSLEDPTLITYFLVSIFFVKFQDLLLKLQFIYVYIAPWQITWGSAFHAFAQPFSVPHSGMLLLHTTISSLLHAPLAPFLGSAVFLTSYVRPLKFWERNYNTKRVDHSNMRLASQIDRGPSSDDNNLNSIFYEHLTLSLQKSLCGDITMGRWGNVYPGDCFIMASDYLNALVHIIQRGNGVITFQLRGLEFSGTYCQQREVEAISEGVDDDFGLCCFRPGHAKNMLSFNAAFNQRWLAWQVQTTKFVLEGYSITDNSATSMLGVYDLRKILLSYMVKSVIYFLTSHDSVEKWLDKDGISEAIRACEVPDYVDVDASFSVTIHDDYDMWLSGISRTKFQAVYGKWITYCSSKREKPVDADPDSKLVTLCYMISVLSRRALGTASSHLTASHVVLESFLYGLHSLFKGDFRITSSKDEWVFNDMDLLNHVIAPGVRMSLKLHQDHFTNADDEEIFEELYDVISENITEMVITHEADPQWRKAVLSNRSSLLALRHVAGDVVDSYFVITLKRRSQGFRVVRVNKECVKGLWAGQQQELVFLRNSNPERGSIQNAKQVLRNMINSSCDQPIGYPIYVSPVTTSFSNTHPQYKKIAGGSMSVQGIRGFLSNLWICIQQSCGGGCNSGGSAGINIGSDIGGMHRPAVTTVSTQVPPTQSVRTSVAGSQSSGSQSNAPETVEQVSVSRMLRHTQPNRSLSQDSRRVGRSTTDDYGSGNVFVSSSSLSGVRSSARWRTGPDGNKIGVRHLSGTGSMEMSPINSKYILPPPLPGKITRNSRREGTESPANSDTIVMKSSSLPSEESKTGVNSVTVGGSGRKIQKSGSGLPAASSSLSSMSRGDSSTVISGQLAPPAKSARKSSNGGLEMEAKSSNGNQKAKSDATARQKRNKQKPPPQQSDDTEKEMAVIMDPSGVFERLEIKRRIDFVRWPNDEWRKRGGKTKWGDWTPKKDMVGEVVFRWYPSHRNPTMKSHIGEIIALLKIEDPESKKTFYVPIAEKSISPCKSEMETTQL